MVDFLIAPLLVFFALLAWVRVQDMARRFARHHPELGPAREEGGGCGSGCGHCGESDRCSANR